MMGEQILGGRGHGAGGNVEVGRDLDRLEHVIFVTVLDGIGGA